MPVETHIDKTQKLITYKATGNVSFQEICDAYESVFDNPDFESGMNALCDGKNAELSVSFHQLPRLIQLMDKYKERRGKGFKVAILVRSNEDFGLTSFFGMQTYSLPFKVEVFRSSKEAAAWLAESSTKQKNRG